MFSFLIAVVSISSFGLEPLRLDQSASQLQLSPHLAYLADDSGQLLYQDVVRHPLIASLSLDQVTGIWQRSNSV